MVEWFVEEGIGEDRAIRLSGDRIVAAHCEPHGRLRVGARLATTLFQRIRGSARGLARTQGGSVIQVDRLPRSVTEGAQMTVEIVRQPIFEAGRTKPAAGRFTECEPAGASSLAEMLGSDVESAVRVVHRFPAGDWDELMAEAFGVTLPFAGGELHLTPAAAMTLVDIDGGLPPRELAMAAIEPVADALRRFDIGGSIGIDFPTLDTKTGRRDVNDALDRALADWPHERTAMNGFGFVQIVARLERPSLLHRARYRTRETALRWLMRKAEQVEAPGPLLLVSPFETADATIEGWTGELARRTGRRVRWQRDPSLAPEGSYVQAIP
ncbi:ribonuclease [Qipengyuania sp. JC766]|uniref:ribonuclease n=1 Tax=Qipengyuania sp. JC766 TaxID=3232139 RepID=UPI00345B01C5